MGRGVVSGYERGGMRGRSQDRRKDINTENTLKRWLQNRGDQRGSHFTLSAIRYSNQDLFGQPGQQTVSPLLPLWR